MLGAARGLQRAVTGCRRRFRSNHNPAAPDGTRLSRRVGRVPASRSAQTAPSAMGFAPAVRGCAPRRRAAPCARSLASGRTGPGGRGPPLELGFCCSPSVREMACGDVRDSPTLTAREPFISHARWRAHGRAGPPHHARRQWSLYPRSAWRGHEWHVAKHPARRRRVGRAAGSHSNPRESPRGVHTTRPGANLQSAVAIMGPLHGGPRGQASKHQVACSLHHGISMPASLGLMLHA